MRSGTGEKDGAYWEEAFRVMDLVFHHIGIACSNLAGARESALRDLGYHLEGPNFSAIRCKRSTVVS